MTSCYYDMYSLDIVLCFEVNTVITQNIRVIHTHTHTCTIKKVWSCTDDSARIIRRKKKEVRRQYDKQGQTGHDTD